MENDSISTTYEFRTNSAQSGGLEKNRRRERISGLGRCSAVRRSAHEAACLLAISAARKPVENVRPGQAGGGRRTRN